MQKADKQTVYSNLGRYLEFASVFILISKLYKQKVCERVLYACDIQM